MPDRHLLYKEQKEEIITILLLAANPSGTDRLQIDKESRAIDEVLRQADFRDKFRLAVHFAVRSDDLQALLLRYHPHIVHFSGHGTNASEIALEDEAGEIHVVPGAALSQLFSVLQDNIRCVVLNACYTEVQARSIAEHVDCVIGMSSAIGDKASIKFATSFYQALGYGRDVKTAFDLACNQINLDGLGEQDKPKLLAIRSDPSKIVFTTARYSPGETPSGKEISNTSDQAPLARNRPSRANSNNITQIIVAIIGAVAVISVAILQFGTSWLDPSITRTPTATIAPVRINYTGKIIALDTQRGIRGAKVSLEYQGAPPVVYTDSEGVFRFSVQFTGESLGGRVRVDAEGYQVYDRFVELSSSNTSIEDIRLEPVVSISTITPEANQ